MSNQWFHASEDPAALEAFAPGRSALICFSHLRWDFVFQRPQHLMTRFAAREPVVFWEEPLFAPTDSVARLDVRRCTQSGVTVVTPVLPKDTPADRLDDILAGLLDEFVQARPAAWLRWYYTPMMFGFSRHLPAACTVYDCMDELANFKFAPPELIERERDLMAQADLVFTGGYSLFEAKRDRHANIHPFPSSVDRDHFGQARNGLPAPDDEPERAGPTLGFYGVLDERMDLELIRGLAEARPEWNIVMLGPVVKIDPADLPRSRNIFYLGGRPYADLPRYLASWDVALMPFAINESTRFISPTKTPEYLAAGKPVVSTPITDVVRHYGDLPGVFIASTIEDFVTACDDALALTAGDGAWLQAVDGALAALSWDETFDRMSTLIDAAVHRRTRAQTAAAPPLPTVRSSSRPRPYDYLIVGAGFAGAVLAERLAAGLGKRVLVIDRRPHVGGNAYDEKNAGGVLMHRYGPHIFHTNSDEIAAYLSRFTRWRPYEHRVLASLPDVGLAPMPINRTTLNRVYGLHLTTEDEAAAFLASRAEPVTPIVTSEDVVVSAIGRDLYQRFFQGYTRKQWGLDPSELDKSVTSRVPTRVNDDDRYFTDSFQAMPADGYTRMFENMLDHPLITVQTEVDFALVRDELIYDQLIFTGPVDEYFDHRFGALPYRSLAFEHVTLDQAWFQPVGTVNYPSEATPYTRISEYKHLTGQNCPRTTITYEYPQADGDPYYPIPRAENHALYKRYQALAAATPNVHFVGRLATYKYYNMDQVVGQALATYRRLAAGEQRTSRVPQGAEVAAE